MKARLRKKKLKRKKLLDKENEIFRSKGTAKGIQVPHETEKSSSQEG